jgi:hypothetical protein
MRISIRASALVLALTLVGCISPAERQAREDAEDHQRCVDMRATPGTNEYFGCRNLVSEQREREKDRALNALLLYSSMQQRQRQQQQQQWQNNWQPVSPITRTYSFNGRMMTCTTMGTYTNCY